MCDFMVEGNQWFIPGLIIGCDNVITFTFTLHYLEPQVEMKFNTMPSSTADVNFNPIQ